MNTYTQPRLLAPSSTMALIRSRVDATLVLKRYVLWSAVQIRDDSIHFPEDGLIFLGKADRWHFDIINRLNTAVYVTIIGGDDDSAPAVGTIGSATTVAAMTGDRPTRTTVRPASNGWTLFQAVRIQAASAPTAGSITVTAALIDLMNVAAVSEAIDGSSR